MRKLHKNASSTVVSPRSRSSLLNNYRDDVSIMNMSPSGTPRSVRSDKTKKGGNSERFYKDFIHNGDLSQQVSDIKKKIKVVNVDVMEELDHFETK